MKHFIKYHPRQCSTVLRVISAVFIILVFLLGLNEYEHCSNVEHHVHESYHIVWQPYDHSNNYARTPNLYGNQSQQKKQQKGANKYQLDQRHQSAIGCETIVGMWLLWSFCSVIISDFFRPLIPFKFYYDNLKKKIFSKKVKK